MNELTPQGPPRVSLTQIIEFGVQKTYHDLTVLAELLPRKTDFERKVEIVNFAERTRQLFIRLLALVKWAGTASKIEQCQDIVSFLDKQALLFINTADNMANIARTTLVQARLPSFQLPCAVEVLTLGTYSRMPTCVRDRIVPPNPITTKEKRATLKRLNQIIEQRLSTANIHPALRNLKIEYGRVTFHVENEFDLKLTVLGDNPSLNWTVLEIDILVEDADTGEGKDLMHSNDIEVMKRIVQHKMNVSQSPLIDVYAKLHNFCLSLQIEVLHDQIDRLKERLAGSIRIKEHIPGQELSVTYWNSKLSLKIQIDQSDPAKPLKLIHQPELVISNNNTEVVERESIFSPGNVSIEQLLTDTIQKRAFIKLNQLATELTDKQYGKCTISGVPSLLHVSCLEPCAPSEELIISIHSDGLYLAHVPQYEKICTLAYDIQESLNANRSKLGTYFDQLKIWLTKRRCIRTIDYLSVTVSETLPLCHKPTIANLDEKVPRLLFQFNKYNHNYLMAEFFISDLNPYHIDTIYSLLVTEPAPSTTSDTLDFLATDCSADLVAVEKVLRLDVARVIGSNYCYETNAQNKSTAYGNTAVPIKKERLKRHSNLTKYSLGSQDICTAGLIPPVSLIDELPQLVSFCEEKLAHLALETELRKRNFDYEVSHTETSGNAYCVTFNQVPTLKLNGYSNALRRDTAVMTVCLHEKPQSSKIWHCSYIFRDCPIVSQSPKEQGPRRLVFTPYESPLLNSTMVSKFIDDTQLDWACMAHLYDVVKEFAREARNEPKILNSIVIKSFNYKKLVILYGDKRCFSVSLMWKPTDRKFQLIFSVVGGNPFNANPHSCMATHYKHEFNQHKSIKTLINNLNITLKTLLVLQELPTYPYLGLLSARPAIAVTSFCLLPLSSTHVKLIYRNWHSIDITIQSDGILVVRDGAYSKFDRDKMVEDLNAIYNFETLLYRRHPATCYILRLSEFVKIFQTAHLEQHLGMSFMIKNIYRKFQPPPSTARPVGVITETNMTFASDQINMQYNFSLDPAQGVVQMRAKPIMLDEWRPEDIEVLERYFLTRIACYPFKADPFPGFCRILFNFQKSFLRDFIELFRMELISDHADRGHQWKIAFCNVMPPGAPFMIAGMSTVCQLKDVTVFPLQLIRKNHPNVPSIYLPLSYDSNENTLRVYIPPRNANRSLPHLNIIDGRLEQFSEQFKAPSSHACVIAPAIKHLLSIPDLWMHH